MEAATEARALRVDMQAALRSQGLHRDADCISQQLEVAFVQRGWMGDGDAVTGVTRPDQLKRKADMYDVCFGLLHKTAGQRSAGALAPLQQQLWSRLMDVTGELCLLLEQQRQQQESLAARHQSLRHEHQVLRSNLRSLKLTVQQLLTDVSTLMQYTASARQQQQQDAQQQDAQQQRQEQQQEQQEQANPQQQHKQCTEGPRHRPDIQQQLQQAGCTVHTPSSSELTNPDQRNSLAGAGSHRGVDGARRCFSADGSCAPSSAAGRDCARDSRSGLVALTMQRLIASIERMSRHFADCQAGKLIEDYGSLPGKSGSSSRAAAAAAAPGAAAAAASSGLQTSGDRHAKGGSSVGTSSSSSAAGQRRASNAASAVGSEASGLEVTPGPGRFSSCGSTEAPIQRPQGSSSSSSNGNSRPGKVPRPPSNGSSSSGGSSGSSGRLKAPGAPVLAGVAAAAAAISTAMAHASAPKGVSSRPRSTTGRPPGPHHNNSCSTNSLTGDGPASSSSSRGQRQQGALQQQGAQGAADLVRGKPDDGMRHSFDSDQAKVAADAWFAHTVRSSGSMVDSEGGADRGSGAAAGAHNSGSIASSNGSLACSQGPSSSRLPQAAAVKPRQAAAPGSQAEAEGWREAGAPRAIAAEASDGSSSSSSLGPSISEVWRPASEAHLQHGVSDAAGAGSAADGDLSPQASSQMVAATALKQQQQPLRQEATGSTGSLRLQQQAGSAQQTSRLHAAAAGASSQPPAPSRTRSGVWSAGSSPRLQSVAAAARPPAGTLSSGPLTAALNSSAARRRAHSASYSSSAGRDSNRAAVGTGPGTGTDSPRQVPQAGAAAGGSDSSGWGLGGSSRSTSSCSQRSGYSSSSSWVSFAPQQQRLRPQSGVGGSRAAYKATGVLESRSSLGSDAVLMGSVGNSPAQTSAAAPTLPHTRASSSAGSSPQTATQPAGTRQPWHSPGAAGGRSREPGAHLQPPEAAPAGASGAAEGCGRGKPDLAAPAAPKAVRCLSWSQPPPGPMQAQLAVQQRVAGAVPAGASPRECVDGTGQQPRKPVHSTPDTATDSPAAAAVDAAAPQTPQPQPMPAEQQQMLVGASAGGAMKQQLQLQPVLPATVGRAQVGLLSPIVEEVLGGSCSTTPRTSTSDVGEVAFVGRGALSDSGYRGSKLRSSSWPSGTPGTEAGDSNGMSLSSAGAADAAAGSMGSLQQPADSSTAGAGADVGLDACRQGGGRANSPKPGARSGSESPPDTAAGKDTSPAQPCKQGRVQDKLQQQGACDVVQGQLPDEQQELSGFDAAARTLEAADTVCTDCLTSPDSSPAPTAPSAKAGAEAAPAGCGEHHQRTQWGHRSWEGGASSSSSQQCLPAAFPVDLSPLSHSLDSLLLDASCCPSDEDHCSTHVLAGPAAVGHSGSSSPAGCCMLDLQDLLAIVLDVMNDKLAADKRYLAAGLPQPPLGRHLQCYVMAKVHSDQAAYSSAMSALLLGLEQHKQVQPEVAVFCRVLSDECDEFYFHHTHLRLRQQLQELTTQALSVAAQHQPPSSLWEHCCGAALQPAQLQHLLHSWASARERQLLLLRVQPAGVQDTQELVTTWEQEVRQHCGCGPEAAVRAGSAVAALLLWELRQQLLRLKPIADAFRAADTRCQGVLALPQFLHFCRRLNQAMSDDEVQVLFYEELQGGREQVTFTAICRALLPAL